MFGKIFKTIQALTVRIFLTLTIGDANISGQTMLKMG